MEKPLTNLVSHFHVIDSEHVPSGEQESYQEISTRIEALCQSRSEVYSLQTDRLNAHRRLATQMRRLEDDIIISLGEKVDRVGSGLNIENAMQRLAELQVSY